MDLYLEYDEERDGGGPVDDPEDNWSLEDEYVHFYPRAIYIDKKAANKLWVTWIETTDGFSLFEPGFLVVVRYRTGSTFGTTSGAWYIQGFHKDEEKAYEIKKSIETGKYSGYSPWVGYFEKLEHVEIGRLVVE